MRLTMYICVCVCARARARLCVCVCVCLWVDGWVLSYRRKPYEGGYKTIKVQDTLKQLSNYAILRRDTSTGHQGQTCRLGALCISQGGAGSLRLSPRLWQGPLVVGARVTSVPTCPCPAAVAALAIFRLRLGARWVPLNDTARLLRPAFGVPAVARPPVCLAVSCVSLVRGGAVSPVRLPACVLCRWNRERGMTGRLEQTQHTEQGRRHAPGTLSAVCPH